MLNEQTLSTLNQLKLFGMAKSFSDKLAHPHSADLSHPEFLGLIVQDEKTYRDNLSGSNVCSITPSSSSPPPSKTSITNIPEA